MGDSQSSSGYNYFFGEADEITRKIEEYQRERGRVNNSPVHVLDNSPMITYHHQNQPTMSTHYYNPNSSEHYTSQDISRSGYHHQFQNQPNTRHRQCFKCWISWLMLMPRRLFVPRSIPTLMPYNDSPHSFSGFEHLEDESNQHSLDEIIERIEERERGNTSVGEGLTEGQISQLPTIKFKPSLEDKMCMICHSDYVRGDKLTILPCTHKYHKDCISHWLQNSKLCCVCQREVIV
ncbi:unnamed protein product [Arabidopsis thaliana]|uniref:RING-type domain-containing protein n=1 Tax=Arabidopsis thaliana TaxID=3702 RepID=A0A5S9Y2H3_ARATH|nr:unnamed protein product [Arabidopsis thaliana]